MSEEKDDIGAILNTSMDEIYDGLESTQEEVEQEIGDKAPPAGKAIARDETGKFAKDDGKPHKSPPSEVDEELEEKLQETFDKVTDEAAKPAVKAPSTWGKAVQEKFATLPEDVQSEILKREADQARGIQRYAEDAKYAHTIRSIVAPYEHLIRQEGGTPEAAISDLLQTAAILRSGTPQQKAQILLQAAQTYGADLSGYIAQAQSLSQLPPEVQRLYREAEEAKARAAQLEAERNRDLTMRQQSEMGAAFDVVHSFASETDEHGNLKHPYFDQARPYMAALMESGLVADIADAYERALGAVPEIRQQIMQAEVAKKVEEERRTKATRAASVAVPSKGTHSTRSRPSTIEETMSATYDAIVSG